MLAQICQSKCLSNQKNDVPNHIQDLKGQRSSPAATKIFPYWLTIILSMISLQKILFVKTWRPLYKLNTPFLFLNCKFNTDPLKMLCGFFYLFAYFPFITSVTALGYFKSGITHSLVSNLPCKSKNLALAQES